MRSDIIRVYKSVHTWTGIVAGLALFVAFYAGALTMFKEPLTAWVTPAATVGQATGGDDAADLIARVLAVHPEAGRDLTVTPGGDGRASSASWSQGREDLNPWTAALGADGQLILRRIGQSALGVLVDYLHRTAGLPGDLELGATVMGVVSAVYAVALVSGVIILLPSLVKDFMALRVGANVKRMWLDAHNLVGIVGLPFHLFIALTAVVFGLHDHIYDSLDATVYQGRLPSIMRASFPAARPDPTPARMRPPAEFYATARALAPGFEPAFLRYRNAGTLGATVMVWGEDPRYLMRGHGFVTLNAVDGTVMGTEYLPGRQSMWSAVVASFFALHFGSFGGEPVRWAYFFLGLSGAFLFYSGNLLWVESRRKRARGGADPGQTRQTRLMAAATLGVCLGCVAGLSLSIAAGKWLVGRVEDVNLWHQTIYYAVFLAALGWAFWRGAARAATDLTWAAATATLAVAVTGVLARVVPALGLPGAGGWGVEAVALAGALALAAMARASARRARTGEADSVWSLRGYPL